MQNPPRNPPSTILLMGVAGSGKSTIGRLLATRLGWRFIEGDDFHPPANIEKMRAGVALGDSDRAPWLMKIRAQILSCVAEGSSCVVACSALKKSYRDILRAGVPSLFTVHLVLSESDAALRLTSRTGHFFAPQLLKSQLETLEPPEDAFEVDSSREPAEIAEEILGAIGARGNS